ncbi:RNA polymerase sigma factor [Actinoplanes utahensis]|uniref:RNA polymerase sigma factor n=1 Tax=Actinoplanes utahensis TaxID=1869 RepID=UPI00068B3A03|nr:sigma-70 family RNA polymerase sigma factor [Actinoplanes utahensis]GIF32871.1 RNA polymerase sigma factor [Actinoplanes utahensis]
MAGPPEPPGGPAVRTSGARSTTETAAFSAFYRAEAAGLVNFLLWMGAGLADAADLTQETMIDAFRSWPDIGHPGAWVRRVASRKFFRRTSDAERPTDPDLLNPLLPPHHDAAEWEQRHDVLRLLALLPWRQRQVMAWSFDGYQPQEIAAELDISPETVRSNLKLARRALALQVEPPGGDAE